MAYVDAFVIPVPKDKIEEYLAFSKSMMHFWTENGCTQYVEAIGDDVPKGEVTSFPLAVKAGDDETVAVGFAVWPDKATRDAANAKMMQAPPPEGPMPFDGKRMFWGGFDPRINWKAGE
jgi:uncharacterized protein YbaA (DUF1428 family)